MLLGGRTIITGPPFLPARLNLDLLTTADVRDVLKCKAHLLRVGIPPDFVAVETLTVIINHYRERVGLKTYLSQMLGELAETPVSECALYWMNGERIKLTGSRPLQRFIWRAFPDGILPFMVKVGEETKYL